MTTPSSYRVTGRVAGGDTYTDYQDGWRGIISPSHHLEAG